MKISFSVKVTIESNEDGGGGGTAAAEANDGDGHGDNPLVDVLLAQCMKSMINDAIKKYVRDKGTPTIGDDDHGHDLSTPVPHRRIPTDADDDEDSGEDGEEDGELQDSEAYSEFAELGLPPVQVDNEHEEKYQFSDEDKYRFSEKLNTMSICRRK